MDNAAGRIGQGPFATLRRFAREPQSEAEVCEMCATPLAPVHDHLLEVEKRKVACACSACAILFEGGAKQRFRRIPRDVRRLHDFLMDDHEWESLLIPINLAFFAYSSPLARVVANYPSPGGVMESSLDIEYWSVVVERNPVVKSFTPDVETLLVNRIGESAQYFRAPIDQCFRLAGTLRKHWRGLSGGSEVWQKIDSFFRELNQLSGAPRA
jgi:hypothetical protein